MKFEETKNAQEEIKIPEAKQEAPTIKPEELSEQMASQSQKEVVDFQDEGEKELAKIEESATKDSLVIDESDKAELKGLDQEANEAKEELAVEISTKEMLAADVEQKTDPKAVLRKGMEMVHDLYNKGEIQSEKYQTLSEILIADGNWKTADQIDITKLQEIVEGKKEDIINGTESFSKAKEQVVLKNESAMKERTIEKPELLSEKKASKKFLAKERAKLAQEIWTQRNAQRERLFKLKNIIDVAQEKIEGESGDKKVGRISELQSHEANTMKERLESPLDLSEQDTKDEQENLSQLIANSENIKLLKTKLEEHYTKADAISKEHFDTLNRSLEHVMKRNNAFIVHKIEERENLRHNSNSNVSNETTYQDDIDILLTLEPSISASSVNPGENASLWPGASGLLLGGGQIGEAGDADIGSHGEKIKKRGGKAASIEEIDKIVGRQDKYSREVYERFGGHGMNELVVNNPEIFGFFQHAGMDENGRFWAGSVEATRHLSEEMPNYYGSGPKSSNNRINLKNIVDSYRKRFSVASERGIPLYIMTENREVYECLNVNNDGTIEVGKKLTPEEVATGKAGLPPEKRKEIGEKLLEKRIFKKQETQEEAREIINNL